MAKRDPYHELMPVKRGRHKQHDTQRDRDGQTAEWRAQKKRARRTIKNEILNTLHEVDWSNYV